MNENECEVCGTHKKVKRDGKRGYLCQNHQKLVDWAESHPAVLDGSITAGDLIMNLAEYCEANNVTRN